ncbi:hypothetical protein HYU92_02255 [Candidatus Curtissbacteria bacterium]|nr:hypothetical protein [Candidatus Curtissbacteria bacterium]
MAKSIPKPKASTQEHLDVDDIVDDLVILKTGWVAVVLSTTAVNFDLLSEAEQDATIFAYGALLNSLSFPVQILIRTKKADITSYFQKLAEAEQSQLNPDLKRQIQKYEDFIRSTVQQKTVLEKEFYLIIDFSPLELGIRGIKGRETQGKSSKAQLISDAKIALFPKRDHLIKQMSRLGLTAKQLSTQELIELFYDIYNPAPTGTQRVILDTSSYTTPMVKPAVEIPSPAPSLAPSATSTTSTTLSTSPLRAMEGKPEGGQLQGTVGGLRPVPQPSGQPQHIQILQGLREATTKASAFTQQQSTASGPKSADSLSGEIRPVEGSGDLQNDILPARKVAVSDDVFSSAPSPTEGQGIRGLKNKGVG